MHTIAILYLTIAVIVLMAALNEREPLLKALAMSLVWPLVLVHLMWRGPR